MVASEDLSIYRLQLPDTAKGQPTFGAVAVLSPLQHPATVRSITNCEYVSGPSSRADSVLILGHANADHATLAALHRIHFGTRRWESGKTEGGAQDLATLSLSQDNVSQHGQIVEKITPRLHQIPEGHSLPSISQFRSEIRLLDLLPGEDGVEIRCQLRTVSLDDLAKAVTGQLARSTDRRQRSEEEERSRPQAHFRKPDGPSSADDPNFVPELLAELDYSKPENANVSSKDFLSNGVNLPSEKWKAIRYLTTSTRDQRSSALIFGLMNRHQSRGETFHFQTFSYAALSYVWGSRSEHRTITIDGKSGIIVTNNLFAALKRLRQKTESRTLWIDSLCIDQTDIKERSWQVQMMGRIYSTAQMVLVWLGDASVSRPSELHGLNMWPIFDAIPDDGRGAELTQQARTSIEWAKALLQETIETAAPPWWTRAWVPQELVLARDVKVAFGEIELPWTVFSEKLWKTWNKVSALGRLISLRDQRSAWQYRGSIGETAMLLRHCDATDVRDKVYALLNLIKPSTSAMIRANYALQPIEIFIQATYLDLWYDVTDTASVEESPASYSNMWLRVAGPQYPAFGSHDDGDVQTGRRPDRYRILNWAKQTPSRLPGLPTWAVDFSDKSAFVYDAQYRLGKERWSFDGNDSLHRHARLRISQNQRKLMVRGMEFDLVSTAVTHLTVRDFRDHASEVKGKLAEIFVRMPHENPFVSVTGPAMLRTDDLRRRVRQNWKITLTNPETIAFSFDDQPTEVIPHWDPSQTDYVDWSKMNEVGSADCGTPGCRCGPSRFFRQWDTCVGLPPDARNFDTPDREQTSPWDDYCSRMKDNKTLSLEKSDPLREEDIGYLIITKHGFVGLARETVQPGDVIALFYGSDVPVVLRACNGHYTYEGRAWINGIMMGELWNIYQDPMLEEKDFEIW